MKEYRPMYLRGLFLAFAVSILFVAVLTLQLAMIVVTAVTAVIAVISLFSIIFIICWAAWV